MNIPKATKKIIPANKGRMHEGIPTSKQNKFVAKYGERREPKSKAEWINNMEKEKNQRRFKGDNTP